ncbi:MAG: DegT/DnrJ/EryC1/StrS family aminotransferase, partial [Desulfovibrionaceae bacterium]|nr:DegT/DnrJ/EryC1/StrS family aminotransferase [Desulfovibrionaceae bacterium]
RRIRPDLERRIKAVLDHGNYILGPEVFELEARLAGFAGAKHCISCASGTDALLMPLMAWGIGPGDAVFVPSFTFFATAEVVSFLGATPVFVDVDPQTFNMDPRALANAVEAVRTRDASVHPLPSAARKNSLRARAVIPVDLFGQTAEYDALLPIAAKHGLLVLEDAAQAFGAEYRGKKSCALGCHASAASFFPAKPLGCYGDGGAVFTEDDALAEVLRSIRAHGKGDDKYDNVRIGLNGRLDTLQAAILLAKLELFPEELEAREQVAGWYAKQMAGIRGVTPPAVREGCVSVWAQYSILVEGGRRDATATHLKSKGIPTNIYYPIPLHLQSVYARSGCTAGDMPASEKLCARILALPFHPYMTEADVERVCRAIAESPA